MRMTTEPRQPPRQMFISKKYPVGFSRESVSSASIHSSTPSTDTLSYSARSSLFKFAAIPPAAGK